MNNILKHGLFGIATNAIDNLTSKSDADARISALEKNNEDYKKQLAAMEAAQVGKPMKKGGKVSSASSRGDGCAQRGKTKGTMVMCGGGMTKGKK
jgi:hypothetical protein